MCDSITFLGATDFEWLFMLTAQQILGKSILHDLWLWFVFLEVLFWLEVLLFDPLSACYKYYVLAWNSLEKRINITH